ncbi:hypothetical protein [uncultured Methylobacterium sp.]|jgi:hypothetical protein|uniref:DUF5983 family protein n=1 Tax=uncultured Methylobacterium sp. TaxID=157278 RepID=UPI002616DED7|nr:hypothetical protein [uncultured Methylobacterium sp.]
MSTYTDPDQAGSVASRHPVRLFLDLSTAHLSPATHAWLDELCKDVRRGDPGAWASCTPFGWFVWAHDQESDLSEFPEDLQACLRKAQALGAEYVLFDRDADTTDVTNDLPWFGDGCDGCSCSCEMDSQSHH